MSYSQSAAEFPAQLAELFCDTSRKVNCRDLAAAQCKYIDRDVGTYCTHHVVWALARVSERHVLRDNSVEHHLHVVPHVGVPVLVDGEAGGGVQQLDVHQAHRELGQLWQL